MNNQSEIPEGFQWDEIISIEDVGMQETIDISVSDDNLFVANEILTHNSAHGKENPGLDTVGESMGIAHTADCQISIWCSEDDKKAGILNIGLMKNRFGPNFGQSSISIDWNTLKLTEVGMNKYLNPPSTPETDEVLGITDNIEKMLLESQFASE